MWTNRRWTTRAVDNRPEAAGIVRPMCQDAAAAGVLPLLSFLLPSFLLLPDLLPEPLEPLPESLLPEPDEFDEPDESDDPLPDEPDSPLALPFSLLAGAALPTAAARLSVR